MTRLLATLMKPLLSMTISYGPTDPFANGKADSRVMIEAGELLTEVMNDGPAFWNTWLATT